MLLPPYTLYSIPFQKLQGAAAAPAAVLTALQQQRCHVSPIASPPPGSSLAPERACLLCLQASKAALTLFSRELARLLSESQIKVIAADPGVTGETGLFRQGFRVLGPSPKTSATFFDLLFRSLPAVYNWCSADERVKLCHHARHWV